MMIEIWRDPSALERVRLADDFAAVVRSDRLAGVMRNGLRDGAVILAALAERTLVGYATLVPAPLADTYELGALETARSVRRQGIASQLLARLPDAIPIERSILFTRGVVHHWDIDEAGVSPIAYRRILTSLLRGVGFVATETRDPEVAEHPLNFLAARYGRKAASASIYDATRYFDAPENSEFAQSA